VEVKPKTVKGDTGNPQSPSEALDQPGVVKTLAFVTR
jgi:hypothetical protein